MNTHYFHYINQTLSLKLKAHFTATYGANIEKIKKEKRKNRIT